MRCSTTVICVLLLVLSITTCGETTDKCIESTEEIEECVDTEYHSYVECMRKRSKRSLDCNKSCDDCDSGNDCNDCDCNYCSYNDCSNTCNSCCESSPPPCQTRNCCHQTCNTQCKSINCRRKCRSKCQSKMSSSGTSSNLNTQTNTNTNVSAGLRSEAKHNITTVINLHNIINNTNIIDMPITLNNTNINNITVEAPEPSAPSGSSISIITKEEKSETKTEEQSETRTDNCCKVVGPRQCMQTKQFPFMKCFHYRKQHCGELCKTAIMHAEPHEVCDQVSSGTPTCHQQVAYIPQPQPKCTYTTSWPYVSCNIVRPNCGGCYTHLVHGGKAPTSCPQTCYDDGFNVGPMYRQGPYFQQQGYPGMQQQVPSCALSGNCEGAPFPMMGQQMQQYYPYENPMENMMQIEPSQQILPYEARDTHIPIASAPCVGCNTNNPNAPCVGCNPHNPNAPCVGCN